MNHFRRDYFPLDAGDRATENLLSPAPSDDGSDMEMTTIHAEDHALADTTTPSQTVSCYCNITST